jgi:hypothetical protein
MKINILLFLFFLLLTSCGINEGITQKAERGYIEFTGNLSGAVAQIDNLEPFQISLNIYQISNGKHRVKVFRGSKLVVDRLLFIDDQTRLEVQIP